MTIITALELLLILALAIGGGLLGWRMGKAKRWWWSLGFLVPLALIVLHGVARWGGTLVLTPPLSWIAAGSVKFYLFSGAVCLMLGTLQPRVKHARSRRALTLLMALVVFHHSAYPVLLPGLMRERHELIETIFDANGVCRQTTYYTCGPAAAVNALKVLGIRGGEGEIAILAHTLPNSGTQADFLAAGLEEGFGDKGVRCDYRGFADTRDLATAGGPVLVEIKYNFFIGHWVAVLDVNDRVVRVADPARGLQQISHDKFDEYWMNRGLVLTRSRKDDS